MEIKRNEATINRPDGDRVLDGTYVFVDIPSYVRQLKDEKAWEKNDRNGITVFKSNHVTIVITALQKGAAIKDNAIDGYLTLQILKGNARISTPDGDVDVTDHQMVNFHPNILHSLEATSDVIILLTTFNREDRI
jgi:quercetin dioxygenase-like cupin family protein